MSAQEHQPPEDAIQEKTLSEDATREETSEVIYTIEEESLVVVHTVEEESLVVVHTVEKDVKPYVQLLIKCKDDWIHHLAQALAFSWLIALVPIVTLIVSIFDIILRNLDTHAQHILTGGLAGIIPQPLSSPVSEVLNKAFDTLSHASGIAEVFILLPAILLGQMLFSLMESCFDVIYHLPPRPFLRRHLVAIVMLILFVALTPIIVLASATPTFILSLLHFVPPSNIPDSNLIVRLTSIAGSIIISLILFNAIYVLVPHRGFKFQTLGRHIHNSWRGALVATVVMQLGLQFFPLYVSSFLNGYVGQVGFVVITLGFFYLFALILLLGAEVNAFFAEGIRVPKSDLITQASKGAYA
jgi:membrane protein